VPRYWFEPETIVLKEIGMKYSPDLVLLGFTSNDLVDAAQGTTGIKVSDGYLVQHDFERMQMGYILQNFYYHSHVARILIHRLLHKKSEGFEAKLSDPEFQKKSWEIASHYLDTMAAIASEQKSKFAIVLIPGHDDLKNPDEILNVLAKNLHNYCQKRGCLFLNPAQNFYESNIPLEKLFWVKDGHYTPSGYEVLAQSIVKSLLLSQNDLFELFSQK
jgi:hypothetical protein